MKNQNDLIFSIVAIVVFLIVAGVCYGTKKEPTVPTPPEAVNLGKLDYPTGVKPVMATALPGSSSSAPGGGPSMGGGMGGPMIGGGGVAPAPGGQGELKKNRPGSMGLGN